MQLIFPLILNGNILNILNILKTPHHSPLPTSLVCVCIYIYIICAYATYANVRMLMFYSKVYNCILRLQSHYFIFQHWLLLLKL